MNGLMGEVRKKLLQTFIIIMPLIHAQGRSERIIQDQYLKYLGIVLVASFCGSIWLSLFMALNVFLFIYHGEAVGLSQILNIFVGICIFMVSKAFFQGKGLAIIKTSILIVTLINIVWMALQKFGVDPVFLGQAATGQLMYRPFHDMVGIFHIKMASGLFMVVASIFMMSNPVVSFLMAIPIGLSTSSSVGFAYASWLVLWSYFKMRKFFYQSLVAIIILCAIFVVVDYQRDTRTFLSRFPVWSSCVRYALLYPLGYGPDSYRHTHKHKDFLFAGDGAYNHAIVMPHDDGTQDFTFYSATNDSSKIIELTKKALDKGTLERSELNSWDNPHNGILNILFQYGLVGLVILIGFIREIILRFKASSKDNEVLISFGCLMAYFMASMTNFPLELARTAYLFPIILGAFYAKTYVVKNDYNS